MDVVSVETRPSRDVLTSRLGAICLGLGLVGLGSWATASRRDVLCRRVQALAVHTVAAVRAILTSVTFVA